MPFLPVSQTVTGANHTCANINQLIVKHIQQAVYRNANNQTLYSTYPILYFFNYINN